MPSLVVLISAAGAIRKQARPVTATLASHTCRHFELECCDQPLQEREREKTRLEAPGDDFYLFSLHLAGEGKRK